MAACTEMTVEGEPVNGEEPTDGNTWLALAALVALGILISKGRE